jgi:predicted membrane chloride channel (bestrophin family)
MLDDLLVLFTLTQAYWALNEVSRELEDPFCFPPNDIPLARLQYQFNERILAAACTEVTACLPGFAAVLA